MKRIYVIAPSGVIYDKPKLVRGVKYLKHLGYDVTLDDDVLSRHMRFAGDDEQRLQGVIRATKSGADVVLAARGGYGLSRLLPQLPYKEIAQSITKGTMWVGYSDFTALQLALWQKTGSVSWQGPIATDFGEKVEKDGTPDCVMQGFFEDVVHGCSEGVGWRVPRSAPIFNENLKTNFKNTIHVPTWAVENATLWGGSLSMLLSLLGTTYFPSENKQKDSILFIEDVAEPVYKIEKMLIQLLQAGVLNHLKALLIGQISSIPKSPIDKGFSVAVVLNRLQTQIPHVPILTNLPTGHVFTKAMLPVGKKVRLALHGQDATLKWASHHGG